MGYGCACSQCRVRSLAGPFVIITLGVLFALDNIWGRWSFRDTWPVLLVVIGLVKVVERLASAEGHGQAQAPSGAAQGETPHAS